jgi:uncharacterized RDD family membrane protein YckC
MSPEQGRGENTDLRSDIYSLGASLFHLITGQPPFEADTPVGTIVMQITEPAPKLIDVEPSVPKRLSAFVDKCLQKETSRRYQNYKDFLKAIEDVMPRKITSAGIYARFSALIFDAALIALFCVLLPGDLGRVVFFAAYFVLLESLFGWTPGKKVMKLAVRKLDGTRALPARIGFRFILTFWLFFATAGILSLHGTKIEDFRVFVATFPTTALLIAVLALLYLLGLASIAVARRKQGFHDSLSGTIVMYEID